MRSGRHTSVKLLCHRQLTSNQETRQERGNHPAESRDVAISSSAPRDGAAIRDESVSLRELEAAGPSAIESFGPEPGGPIVRVDISSYAAESCTFRVRCGLVVAGGES